MKLLTLLPLALLSCHETPQAAVAQAIDLTNAACALAPDSPVGQPYVELVCTIAQGSEQLVSVILGASTDAGVTTATASLPVTQLRIRVPAANAPAFLAAHKGAAAH